jgi:hypothetical protein
LGVEQHSSMKRLSLNVRRDHMDNSTKGVIILPKLEKSSLEGKVGIFLLES